MSDLRAQPAARALLVWLSKHEESCARNRYNIPQRQFRERVVAEFPRIDPHTLDKVMDERRSTSGAIGEAADYYLFGPLSTVGGVWLPVISVAWDFEPSPAVLRFRVALFVEHKGKLLASAHRYETPEGVDGMHNYYHVQPIGAFGKGGRPLPGPTPVNESQPAIPLDARSPVSVILAALIALYGIDFVRTALRGAQNAKRYVQDVFCLWERPNP